MNTTTSLGSLAYAVIEQYGELARSAVASSVGRRQAACLDDKSQYRACTVIGHLYSEEELSLQFLQSGNWLSIGYISDGACQLAVEINLTTQEVRERPNARVEFARSDNSPDRASATHPIPPADDSVSWSAT